MFKLEIASLFILTYIAVAYFSAKKTKNIIHYIFSAMMIVSYVTMAFQIITLITVNARDVYSADIVEVTHNIFTASFVVFFWLAFVYIDIQTSGNVPYRGMPLTGYLNWFAPLIVPAVLIIVIPFEYVDNPNGNYAAGPPVWIAMAAIALFLGASIRQMIKFRKVANNKRRFLFTLGMIGIAGLALYQYTHPEVLINGFGIVLMDMTFYLTTESPDVLLIEQLKYEKNRADEANNAKSAFLANMSHEIRTPMNAIVGITEILTRTNLDAQQRSYLRNIQQSGKSLLLIINDILDFSKIEAGKMELIDDEYDSVSMVNDVSMIILNRIGDKPVELIFDVDPNIPKRLYGDMGRIKQIIINLMNNAVKFTEEGYVKLTVRAERSPLQTECTLFFEVEDTGQGIKEEDLSKLFESFQQVDSKRNRNKEGTGLGLAISRQLTEMMGGKLSVESTYNVGSTFKFYIKQRIVNNDPLSLISRVIYEEEKPKIGGCFNNKYTAEHTKKVVEDFGFEYREITADMLDETDVNHLFVDSYIFEKYLDLLKEKVNKDVSVAILQNPMKHVFGEAGITVLNKPFYCYNFCRYMNHELSEDMDVNKELGESFTAPDAKILIVDDNEINLKVAVGLLAPLEMRIDVASSGKRAIELSKKERYDIIFMDHMMPIMDGVETSKIIREMPEFENYYKDALIVALTANVSADAIEHFGQANVTEFLPKPIDSKQMMGLIKRSLPAEYIVKYSVELADAENADDLTNLPIIKGLDVINGIKNSGSKELFESLLGDFYNIVEMKAQKMEKCLDDNMIRDFTIEVHAMKNTCRMIGADHLSDLFKELEDLGNEEKVEVILQKAPEAIQLFRSYKDELKPYAVALEKEKEEVPMSVIIETLEELKAAVNDFDMDGTDQALDKLNGYQIPEECSSFMENLRAYVADYAMEDIIETADNMKSLIELGDNK